MGWWADKWNEWTGGAKPAESVVAQNNTARGQTWVMDPETLIARRARFERHEQVSKYTGQPIISYKPVPINGTEVYVAPLERHVNQQTHRVEFSYAEIPSHLKSKYPNIKPLTPREGHPMFAFGAGHGVEKDMKNGKRAIDFGCQSSDEQFQEANITLHYARTAAYKMNLIGGDVILNRTDIVVYHKDDHSKDRAPYTRDGHSFRRAAFNNAFAGGVEFHVDHAPTPNAKGTTTIVDERASELSWSGKLATVLRANLRHMPMNQQKALKRLDPDYQPVTGWDYAKDTKNVDMGLQMISGKLVPRTPVVVQEVGFISNPKEAATIMGQSRIDAVTDEVVRDLWNFNEIRATMLGGKAAQTMIRQNPGMADLVREISGKGNPRHNSIMFVEPPTVPNAKGQAAHR